MESSCNEYNDLAQRLKLLPPTAQYAGGVDYELSSRHNARDKFIEVVKVMYCHHSIFLFSEYHMLDSSLANYLFLSLTKDNFENAFLWDILTVNLFIVFLSAFSQHCSCWKNNGRKLYMKTPRIWWRKRMF